MQKSLSVCEIYSHLYLKRKKDNQTTSYWSIFKRNYGLKNNFQNKREIWSMACYPKFASKLPMRCHEQPELAPFTPLWLGMSAHTDCSSIARAVSRKGWVMCLPYVSHYAHTWLFRKETPSWQSKAKLSGAQILHDLHKN